MPASSTIFSVEELTTATNNFEWLVGSGGCGEVFEGVLAKRTKHPASHSLDQSHEGLRRPPGAANWV